MQLIGTCIKLFIHLNLVSRGSFKRHIVLLSELYNHCSSNRLVILAKYKMLNKQYTSTSIRKGMHYLQQLHQI